MAEDGRLPASKHEQEHHAASHIQRGCHAAIMRSLKNVRDALPPGDEHRHERKGEDHKLTYLATAYAGKAAASLWAVPLKKLLKKQDYVCLYDSDSVQAALEKMIELDTLSLPVSTIGGQPSGILNIEDIMVFLVFSVKMTSDGHALSMTERLALPVRKLIDVARMEDTEWDWKLYKDTDPLHDVLYPFGTGRVFRVIVESSADAADMRLLSRFDIIDYLHRHKKGLDAETLEASCDSLRIGEHRLVVTVQQDETLRAGYHRMLDHHSSSAAVVDADGKIVCDLSITALRGLQPDMMDELLDMPVLDYLKLVEDGEIPEVIVASAELTVEECLSLMIEHPEHPRVWLVDDDNVPVGKATHSDIIEAFAPKTPEQFGSRR